MEHGYRELYISGDRELKQTSPQSLVPVRNEDFPVSAGIQYKMGEYQNTNLFICNGNK